MKKVISITFLLFILACSTKFSGNVAAQQISFLGVPLAGNIENFTNKLKAKGTKVNKEISSLLDVGQRAFDVTIFPYYCQSLVQYNPSTKNVYEGTLMFSMDTTLNEFTNFADIFTTQIEDKYGKGIFIYNLEEVEYNGFPGNHYKIFNKNNNIYIGEIYLYMNIKNFDKQSEKGRFMLHVMYRNSEAPSFDEQMQDYF